MGDFDLLLHQGSIRERGAVMDRPIRGWRRSKEWGKGSADGVILLDYADDLAHFFYNQLGAQVYEFAQDAMTWSGFIWEMRLSTSNTTLVRSYEGLLNSAMVLYNGGNLSLQEGESIAQFGRVHRQIDKTIFDSADATNITKTMFARKGWGHPRLAGRSNRAGLEIVVVGWWKTLTFQWVSMSFLSPTPVSMVIASLLLTFSEFVSGGEIFDDGRVFSSPDPVEGVLWDVLTKLTEGSPNVIVVTDNQKLNYIPIDHTPAYFIHADGRWVDRTGRAVHTSSRHVEPCVIRDVDFPAPTRSMGALALGVDAVVTEIEVDEGGRLIWRSAELGEGEMMR